MASVGIEPTSKDFQSFANPSQLTCHIGTSGGIRTHDLCYVKTQLYHWATDVYKKSHKISLTASYAHKRYFVPLMKIIFHLGTI